MGTVLEPRFLDFSITATPIKVEPSFDNPHPIDPPDSVRLQAVRLFMMHSHALYKRMHEVDKSLEEDAEALKLDEAFAGAERGEERRHPHAQQSIRVRTRRSLKACKELIETLLIDE